jgi:DMSO/TMAO reductase YedYZ molybdopterin-dependent catalytic subunit
MLLNTSEPGTDPSTDTSKRSFIYGAGAVVGIAALSAGFGRVLLERAKRAAAGRADVVLPTAADPLPEVPSAASFDVAEISPILVPNEDFYRIDTALSVPRIDLQEWELSIKGMVDRPYTISYADLLDMRMVERDVTLSCVSNQVGGGLVGNARWRGVPLTEILDRAGVSSNAEQIVGRSVDDFTVGFPVDVAYDGREALVAVGMNGEPLPFEHGFPARLVVAGLYGYVSATKWISEIELTTWDGFDAYWVPRGWSKEAPIKTQSRIDTPQNAQTIEPGTHTVAGVAWAPSRGISKVEVQLGENAPWVEADLSEPLSENAWVQWQVQWDAMASGRHELRVRATDGDGNLQTEDVAPPAPNGATGWHTQPVYVA